MSDHTDTVQDESEELGAEFFAGAVLTRPGESIVEVVLGAFELPAKASDANK